mgnify:FL=1
MKVSSSGGDATRDYQKILNSLKKILKHRSLRYSQIAKALDCSELTIKRLLNGQNASITRLLEVLDYLNLSLSDVVEFAQKEPIEEQLLTDEQEKVLVNDPATFATLWAIQDGHDSEEKLQECLGCKRTLIQRVLKKLEELELIIWNGQDDIRLKNNGFMRPKDFKAPTVKKYFPILQDLFFKQVLKAKEADIHDDKNRYYSFYHPISKASFDRLNQQYESCTIVSRENQS